MCGPGGKYKQMGYPVFTVADTKPIALTDKEKNVLVLHIPKTYDEERGNALESAQYCWKISASNLSKMDLILAVVTRQDSRTKKLYRVVVDAFRPHNRLFDTKIIKNDKTGKKRTAFIGKSITDADIRARLVNRYLLFNGKLPTNPIYYLDQAHKDRRIPYLTIKDN